MGQTEKSNRTESDMIEGLIRLLDEGAARGVGHMNIAWAPDGKTGMEIQTGSPDCSIVPTACSVPTLHEGLDREENG